MSEKPFPYTEELLDARRKRKETVRNRRGVLYGFLGAAAVIASFYYVGAKDTDKPSNPEKAKSTKEITVGPDGQFSSLAGAVLSISELNPNLNSTNIRKQLFKQNHEDQFHPNSDETLSVPGSWKTKESNDPQTSGPDQNSLQVQP